MKKDHGALLGKKVISCAVSLLMTATMFPSSSVWADDGARELGKSDFSQYHARSLGPGGDGDLLDNSLDNNTSTYTNSSYIGAGDLTGVELANPQYYCFHLNTPMSISKVGVQPRSSGHLNQLKAFKVYVGSTEEDLVLVKEGTVTTADMTYVEFTPVTGSVVKIEMTPEEGGNCVSTAEVEIWGAEIQTSEVNKTALQEQIDATKDLKEEDYVASTWTALQTALEEANKVNEDISATQDAVTKATEALKTAIENLVKAGKSEAVSIVDNGDGTLTLTLDRKIQKSSMSGSSEGGTWVLNEDGKSLTSNQISTGGSKHIDVVVTDMDGKSTHHAIYRDDEGNWKIIASYRFKDGTIGKPVATLEADGQTYTFDGSEVHNVTVDSVEGTPILKVSGTLINYVSVQLTGQGENSKVWNEEDIPGDRSYIEIPLVSLKTGKPKAGEYSIYLGSDGLQARNVINLTINKIVEVNKTTLQEQIDAANKLKEEDYTEESWAKLQEILNKANEINEKEEATQEEVDKAAEDLKNAIEALEEAIAEPVVTLNIDSEEISGASVEEAVTQAGLQIGFIDKVEFVSGKVTKADLTYIGKYADSLVFKLSDTLSYVGDNDTPSTVFPSVTGAWNQLESLTLEGFTEIAASAFLNRTSLSEVNLTGVEKINASAFNVTKNAPSKRMKVTISDSIKEIGMSAFSGQSKRPLDLYLDVADPSTLSLHKDAFSKISSTSVVYVPEGALTKYATQVDPANAFNVLNNAKWKTMRVEDPAYQFMTFQYDKDYPTNSMYAYVKDGASLSSIAFNDALMGIINRALVEDYGEGSVLDCWNTAKDLSGIDVVSDTIFPLDVDRVYAKAKKEQILVTAKINGTEVGGASVEEIITKSGTEVSDVETIEFVSGNVTAEDLAYLAEEASYLEELTINLSDTLTYEEGSTVFPSGFDRTRLVKVSLGGFTEISSGAFEECTRLKEVNMPDMVKIGRKAFYRCSDFEVFTLPASIQTIESQAFTAAASGTRELKVTMEATTPPAGIVSGVFEGGTVTVPAGSLPAYLSGINLSETFFSSGSSKWRNLEVIDPSYNLVTFQYKQYGNYYAYYLDNARLDSVKINTSVIDVPEGQRLAGWNTKKDGSGVTYTDETLVSDKVTLYPVFEATADKTELQKLYDEASAYQGEGTGYDLLQKQLTSAKEVLDNSSATQEEVDKAVIKLNTRYYMAKVDGLNRQWRMEHGSVSFTEYTTDSLIPVMNMYAITHNRVNSSYGENEVQGNIGQMEKWYNEYETAIAGLKKATADDQYIGMVEDAMETREYTGSFEITSVEKVLVDGQEKVRVHVKFNNTGIHPIYGESLPNANGATEYKEYGSLKTSTHFNYQAYTSDMKGYTSGSVKELVYNSSKDVSGYIDLDSKYTQVYFTFQCNRKNETASPWIYQISQDLPSPVDKTKLQEQIDATKGLKEEDYTTDSWSKLQETLKAAQTINEKEDATQEEVNKATEDLKNAIAGLEEAPDVQEFKDVPTSAWFYEAVEYVNDKGYMTGMDPDAKPLPYFGAVEELSRAHFATLLYRIAGSPEVTYENKFKDVPDGQFYTDAVIWASNEGIITGYTEGPKKGLFGASDNITREQIAVMMYRYAQYAGMDTSAKADLSTFPDGNKTSAFAKDAMAWAVGAGLISGNEDGTLAPQGEVSRAVCATIVMRFDKNFN